MKEFTRLEWLIGTDFEKLRNAKVLVLGLGGVGGYVVEALARSGVGTLILVDYDTVDITNCNRQIIATNEVLGQEKTKAFEARIHSISKDCKVISMNEKIEVATIDRLFIYEPDFIVDACDTIPVKCECIKACLERKIPFISSMGTANKLDPTKLEIVDIRKTSYDPIAKIVRNYVKKEKLKGRIPVVCSTESPKKIDGKLGTIITVPAVCGMYLAHYTIQTLIKGENQ
ncbi:MAG: tRNA threonylcarbamoyladenosine dehydratase [Firmicutes bacterium]|nr:tRNA threonylcarbamoyladenosine dehydratase [Bacillota bacterium]